MPSRVPEPRRPRARRRLARLGWLCLLFVLALHPAALAGQAGSSGLAVLLRELLCGCATCAGELAATAAPQGCCEREEAPARESDCGASGGCTCTHPDEVPLSESTLLAQPDGSRRDLLSAAGVSSDELQPVFSAAEATPETVSSAVDYRPPPGWLPCATHERRVRATRDRLAWLATFLI